MDHSINWELCCLCHPEKNELLQTPEGRRTSKFLERPGQARTQGGVGGVVRHPLKQPREFERYLIAYCTCQQKDVQ